jgi:hypothetical protein
MSTNRSICVHSYIGEFFNPQKSMVMFVPMILEFSDESFLRKNYIYIPKNKMIICNKFVEKRCSMVIIYLVHVTRLIRINSVI